MNAPRRKTPLRVYTVTFGPSHDLADHETHGWYRAVNAATAIAMAQAAYLATYYESGARAPRGIEMSGDEMIIHVDDETDELTVFDATEGRQ